MSAVHFTAPCPADVKLQDACGMPLGLVAQPLAAPHGGGAAAFPSASCWASDLARCARCHAYINALSDVDEEGWSCSLCGCANDFSSATCLRRYYGLSGERRAALPELAAPAVEALCPLVAADPDEGGEEVLALEAQPAVLALVDCCCSEEGLELVRSALAAAVEALPPAARFGLVSFGSKMSLHPTGGGNGGILHIPLAGAEGGRASLQEAAPLGRMLARVGSHKAAILAAIEGLEVEPTVGGGRQRALGDALRAVLRWVAVGAPAAAAEGLAEQRAGGEEGAGGAGGLPGAHSFPGMRLLLFLSGPPNCGAGAVVALKPSPAEEAAAAAAAAAAAESAARELAALTLDPQFPELSAWSDAVSRTVAEARQPAVEAAAAAAAAAGDLSHAAPPGVDPAALAVNLAASDFYAEAGAAAAALGLIVDLFAACPHWLGLDLLEPLVSASGGTMALYRSLDAAALPQDVYKSVAQPRALACLLRLRCSPELELQGAHGRLAADSEHPNLFRLPACSTEDAFSFDLDRSSARLACSAPAVQLVLQYSVLLPAAGEGGAPGDGSRFVLQRRMRVVTAALPLAHTAEQLLAGCDAEALATLVVHKSLATAAEQGLGEARQMVADWLALLAAAAAEARGGGRGAADASLADVQALHHLPHLLFALLSSPLLQARRGGAEEGAGAGPAAWQHPDTAALLRSLLRVLPPDELSVAVCPQLSSWAGPEEAAVLQHSLSEAALSVGQKPLWVLDSFFQLIVLCRGGMQPPPADSLLGRTLAGIRAARRCTPEVLILREGEDEDASPFYAWLLEDAAAPAAAAAAGGGGDSQQPGWPSFVDFLNAATREAQRLLPAK